ncbi:MAG: AIM24 family protein [Actinomycetota bacterium]|nr:AIM24 family protein [Actinomycetota bacterium]
MEDGGYVVAQLRTNGHRVVEAHLNGDSVKALTGSMVAYEGKVQFKKASFGAGEGVMKTLKRKATGESLDLMECVGQGVVYLAQMGSYIELIALAGDKLSVESSALLAYESTLSTNVTFAGMHGMSAGQGLTTTSVSGHGAVAILSDGPAICLEVSPQYPVTVDPQAYLGSSGQLQQGFVTGVNWKSLIGEGSGEPFSLQFSGTGRVWIQPAER